MKILIAFPIIWTLIAGYNLAPLRVTSISRQDESKYTTRPYDEM